MLIWRNAPADEQAIIRRLAEPLLGLTEDSRRPGTGLRLLIAGLLLAIGLTTLVSAHESIALLRPLGGVVLVIAAIAVVWGRGGSIARDLVVERQAPYPGRGAGWLAAGA